MTQPTETPPAEGSTGMVRSEHSNDANSGPVAGNRTPMFWTLGVLGLIVVFMMIAFLTRVIDLAD